MGWICLVIKEAVYSAFTREMRGAGNGIALVTLEGDRY